MISPKAILEQRPSGEVWLLTLGELAVGSIRARGVDRSGSAHHVNADAECFSDLSRGRACACRTARVTRDAYRRTATSTATASAISSLVLAIQRTVAVRRALRAP